MRTPRQESTVIRRMLLNFLQCFLVATFTKLQNKIRPLSGNGCGVRRSTFSSIYSARFLDEEGTGSSRTGI